MKKVIVKNTANTILQTAQFDNDSHMNEWLEMLARTSAWGKPEHQVEVSPRILDDEGNVVQEAVFETIPAEYTIEIEDIAAEIEIENVRKREKKEKKESLKKIKWTEVNTIAELKMIVKGIIAELED